MSETEKETNRRLLKKYGITLEHYNMMLNAQGGRCKICGRPPFDRRLAVDHDHKLVKLKVITKRVSNSWLASAIGWFCKGYGGSKNEAIQNCREGLKIASIRGLICYKCNTSLGKLAYKGTENPKWLRAAADYLEAYDRRLNEGRDSSSR